MEVLLASTEEFAQTALGLDGCQVVGERNDIPNGSSGVYCPLVGVGGPLEMGIISDDAGCKVIAGALLGMEADEAAELDEVDMVDAFGEVINIIAGIVKQKVNDDDPSMNLGLPMFLSGRVRPMEHQDVAITEIKLGDTAAQLMVLTPRRRS